MIHPAPDIRKRIYELLNGTISYGSQPVPVYEGEDSPVLPYKILIGDYTDADASNKNKFGALATQTIEVVAEQPTGIKKNVDAIGKLVGELIHPTNRSQLLSIPELTVIVLGKPNTSHLIEDSGEGQMIVRLILRYNLLINEN